MKRPKATDRYSRNVRDGWDAAETEWADGFDREADAQPEHLHKPADIEAWLQGYHSHWDHLEALNPKEPTR